MADQPHKWAILNDYAKSVITLATSLLALSVTFADKLGSTSPDVVTRLLLGLIWFCLGLATVCGVLLAAALFGVLRRKTRLEEIEHELGQAWRSAAIVTELQNEKAKSLMEVSKRERQLIIVTNGTYFAIIASVVAFSILGLQPRSPKLKLSTLVEAATKEAAAIRTVKRADLKVIGVELSPNGDVYTVQLGPQPSASDGKIRNFDSSDPLAVQLLPDLKPRPCLFLSGFSHQE
jgi:hypothetical protein